ASTQQLQIVKTVLEEKEAVIATMQSGLGWRLICSYRRTIDRIFPLGSRRRLFYEFVHRWVRANLTSGRLTLKRPIRTSADSARDHADFQTTELEDDLLGGHERAVFNIDHLIVKRGKVYGWGWVYHPTRPVVGVGVKIEDKQGQHFFPCRYGLHRLDVAQTSGIGDESAASGFIVSCRLPPGEILQFKLEIRFQEGRPLEIDLSSFLDWRVRGVSRRVALARRWLNRAGDYLSRGDLIGLMRSVHAKMEQVWRHAKLKKNDVGELLRLVRNPTQGNFVLVVDHNLGGGANFYRERLINQVRSAGRRVLLVYYDLPMLDYYLRYLDNEKEACCAVGSIELLPEMARSIRLEEVFLNNAFSFDDPLAVATVLSTLKIETGVRLTVAVHDYFMVCPSYTLLDYQGNFCGVPQVERCRRCLPNHDGEFAFLTDCRDIDLWRRAWGACLRYADRILCFSRSSVDLLRLAYPDLDEEKFEVRPHTVDYLPRRCVTLDYGSPLNIGIVGRITEHKGARIVREMVSIIEERKLPVRVTVLGEMDGAPASPVLRTTGSYRREELPDLIECSGTNLFFLPSICPETFSFVAEELMQLGVPLAVFNLGAPAERVRTYALGLVIDKINAEYALEQLIAFHVQLRASTGGIASNG
ncbi:MAG: glycosyltransferase, partial [Moorellaceae bacterium]